MLFRIELDIRRPIEQVWAAFVDRALLSQWQATLRDIHPVSGPPGEVGTVTRLTYREAGRDVVMTETVAERVPPDLVTHHLTSSMMTSTLRNRFSRTDDGLTRWVVECDIRFRGVWKLMALFGRRLIVRKTEEDMRRFKRLVESLTSGEEITPSHQPSRTAR